LQARCNKLCVTHIDRFCDSGVLDLDRDCSTVMKNRSVYLPIKKNSISGAVGSSAIRRALFGW
jgi:hypothetical protein